MFFNFIFFDSICVQKGQSVAKGQIIGVQGTTGNSTGENLHFEIRIEDKTTIDPITYLFGEI